MIAIKKVTLQVVTLIWFRDVGYIWLFSCPVYIHVLSGPSLSCPAFSFARNYTRKIYAKFFVQ